MIDLNNLDYELYAELVDEDLLEVETDKYVKYYKKINGEWVLRAVEDEDREVTTLTSIPDFKTTYADVENGRIWNDLRNDFSKASKPNYYGYIYSSFEGKPVSIHVLIMSAFTQMRPEEWRKQGLEIDHISGSKVENHINNLALVTRQEQYDKRVRAKMSQNAGTPLDKDEVQYIKYLAAMLEARDEKVDSIVIHMIAKRFGKKYETIRKVVNGVTHKDVELTDEMKKEVMQARLQHDLEQVSALT